MALSGLAGRRLVSTVNCIKLFSTARLRLAVLAAAAVPSCLRPIRSSIARQRAAPTPGRLKSATARVAVCSQRTTAARSSGGSATPRSLSLNAQVRRARRISSTEYGGSSLTSIVSVARPVHLLLPAAELGLRLRGLRHREAVLLVLQHQTHDLLLLPWQPSLRGYL